MVTLREAAREDAVTRLVAADHASEILPEYRGTPLEAFLRYHNLGETLPPSSGRPALLVGMCMDNRKDLTIPNEFAFVLRAAGGNLRDHEFDISYAVAMGGVTTEDDRLTQLVGDDGRGV